MRAKTFFLITHVSVGIYTRIILCNRIIYIYTYVCRRTTDNSLYYFFSTFLFFVSYKFVSSVTSYIDLRRKTLQPLNQSELNGLQSDIVLLWDIILRILCACCVSWVCRPLYIRVCRQTTGINFYGAWITSEEYILRNVWGVMERFDGPDRAQRQTERFNRSERRKNFRQNR